jgi:hypothetical protein
MNPASSDEIVESFRIEAKTGGGFQDEYLSSGRSMNYAG